MKKFYIYGEAFFRRNLLKRRENINLLELPVSNGRIVTLSNIKEKENIKDELNILEKNKTKLKLKKISVPRNY